MGVTFDQVVGPRSSWPVPGSWALYLLHKAYQRFRENEIPSATNRAIKKYVMYGAGGSATGGTGTGTQVNPYLVRHTADLKSLTANVLALLGTNVGVIFYDDDIIPGSQANTDQSIVNWAANVSFGRDGLGTRKPEITGFVPMSGASVAGTVATFSLAAGLTPYWSRSRPVGSLDRDDFRANPHKKAASQAEMSATPYSWYFNDAADTIEVNFGTDDSATIEITFNTGAGLRLGDYDRTAVDGLILEGFGMNSPGASGGGLCLKIENTGTNVCVVRDSEWNWGPYHTGGKIVTGTGGITTYHRCQFGLHQWDSGGTGDGCIDFASGGSHEWARYDCTNPWGGLDTVAGTSPTKIPQTPYAHSNNDTTQPFAYAAEIDCDYDPQVGVTLQSNTIGASVGAIANKDLTTSYRLFTYNRRCVSKSIAPSGHWGIHYRPHNIVNMADPSGAFYVVFSGNTPLKGLTFSGELQFAVTGDWAAVTASSIRVFQSTSAHDFRWNFLRWRVTGANPRAMVVGGDFSGAGRFKTCSLENCVFSNETAMTSGNITFAQTNGLDHFWNANPRVETGGISGLAHYGLAAAQLTATLGTISLAAAGDWTTAATVPSALKNAAKPLPSGLECQFDFVGKMRSYNNAQRSIGSIEGNPAPDNEYTRKKPYWKRRGVSR